MLPLLYTPAAKPIETVDQLVCLALLNRVSQATDTKAPTYKSGACVRDAAAI
jgi:hypothetical protein